MLKKVQKLFPGFVHLFRPIPDVKRCALWAETHPSSTFCGRCSVVFLWNPNYKTTNQATSQQLDMGENIISYADDIILYIYQGLPEKATVQLFLKSINQIKLLPTTRKVC